MKKLNPLFLDSTKPIGETYVANVELTNVVLYDNEVLYFEMLDVHRVPQRYAMKKIETKKNTKYCAEVWLKPQQQIEYRFVILRDGYELQSSAMQVCSSSPQITQQWVPETEPKLKKEKQSANKKTREVKSASTKTLCTPYLTEQLKLLIDDLV